MMNRVRVAMTIGWCALLFAASALMPARAEAQTQTLYGLVQGSNTLVRFDSATPGTIETLSVIGVVSGETLRGIDFRPLTGQLYAMATDATGAQVRIYVIDPATGVATGFASTATVPTPGSQWGMSFNPAADRIRLVNANGENIRINPINAAFSGNDSDLSSPVAPAPVVDAVAYDRQFPGATQTTLFAINRATHSLAVQGGINGAVPPGPNGGSITDIGPLTIALNQASATGLEMTSNGILFATLRPSSNNLTGLYTVNVSTGAATLVGLIGDGSQEIGSLAVVDPTLTMSPDSGTYIATQWFDLVLMLNLFGRSVTGGSATFDGLDVSGPLASCVVPGTGAAGLITLRCAGLGGPVVGAGTHVLEVTLGLSDGSQVRRAVTWTVLPVVE
jgi:hypothetical protein